MIINRTLRLLTENLNRPIIMFQEFFEKVIMPKAILRTSMHFGPEMFWDSMQNGI